MQAISVDIRTNNFTSFVPEVWFPLSLANCTCTSLLNTSNPNVTCVADAPSGSGPGGGCGGSQCSMTYGGSAVRVHTTVEPCVESVGISIQSSSGNQLFSQVFTHSEAMDLTLGQDSTTLLVQLNQYRFSMEVEVRGDACGCCGLMVW